MTDDQKLEDLRKRLDKEHEILRATRNIRKIQESDAAKASSDAILEESQQRIEYFQNEMKKLLSRMMDGPAGGSGSDSVAAETTATTPASASRPTSGRSQQPTEDTQSSSLYRVTSTSTLATKPTSTIDLLKSSGAITTNKVVYKLRELTYKLDVENKVKQGSEKLESLGVNAANTDSTEKVILLKRALQKYQGLYLPDEDDTMPVAPGMTPRRPVTGVLHVRVAAIRHLSHAPKSQERPIESMAAIKIDGVVKAKTSFARMGSQGIRWNEDFAIPVNKASEIEIAVYDRVDNGSTPVGLFWLKLSDLVEELQRKKVEADNEAAWAESSESHVHELSVRSSGNRSSLLPSVERSSSSTVIDGVDSWWDLEPIGQIGLKFNLVKDVAVRNRPSRLGRQGAVRKRMGEVKEIQGHKFVTQKFFEIMCCALCNELFTGRGSQCEECPVLAHDDCSELLPNHCGLPAERANMMMEEIRRRKNAAKHTSSPPDSKRAPHALPPGYEESVQSDADTEKKKLQEEMQEMTLNEKQQQSPPAIPPRPAVPTTEQSSADQARLQQQKQQLLEQQRYQQQIQQQQIESEVAYQLAQQQAAVEAQRLSEQAEQRRVELLLKEREKVEQYQQQQQQQQQKRPTLPPSKDTPTGRKTSLNDFHFLAVLGKGNFGKVMLAEDKKGGELFAIKALKKDAIVQQNDVESARSEKRIFQVANKERHPFLTTLHSCFQSDTRLYFVMEYVRGGDLMMHIQRDRRFGERRAKFYGCEVLLALQYFHQNDIVYRDLKLDNILLTLDGHIKIADYGLCKENMGYGATTRTICGTPEFMAPEIIEEQPYGRSIDWWTFGVLMYEMLLGRAPFSGEEEEEIYDSIMEDEPMFPHGFGRNERALLQSLLVKTPHLRLGSGPTDAEEIKGHAYFRDVNFDDVYHKRIPPPFMPTISNAKDVSNFDPEFTKEIPGETPTDYRLNHVEQGLFRDFSYVSPWLEQQ
ncbi:Serine/threonine kinase [Gryganskiella cystojenkinii]|nr:Serine/threonine kinase [Gryganskiella cystojenkinii]